jgi:phage terminase Nu1 subunit (DNA packaging protein)
MHENGDLSSKFYLKTLKQFKILYLCHHLLDIFDILNRTTEKLQKQGINLKLMKNLVKSDIESLTQLYLQGNIINGKKATDFLENLISVEGITNIVKYKNIDLKTKPNTRKKVEENVIEIVKLICDNLMNRFPEDSLIDNLDILNLDNLKDILLKSNQNEFAKLGESEIRGLCKYFRETIEPKKAMLIEKKINHQIIDICQNDMETIIISE